MLEVRPGPDPYIFYKLNHLDRARAAWLLSEELGIYEALRDGPSTIGEISQRTKIPPRPVEALLCAGSCLGILGVEDDRYFIYPIMREFVLKDGRAYSAPYRPPTDDFWYNLSRSAILEDKPHPDGTPPWIGDPMGLKEKTHAFNPSRHGWRILWGEALAEAFDFTPYRTILDIGGATGGVLVGLTGKVAGLKGILMELPFSRDAAEAAIEETGGADRVRFFSGDFFKGPFPEDIDVIFMSHVIHDWNDEECLQILGHCYEALPAGSPILVQEYLLDDDKSGQILGVFQWFGLLSSTTGDQRTSAEIGALLAKAGFSDLETRPIDAEQSIVIGWKK